MELIGIVVAVSVLLLGLGGLVLYACCNVMWKSRLHCPDNVIGKTLDHIDKIPTATHHQYDSMIQVLGVKEKSGQA